MGKSATEFSTDTYANNRRIVRNTAVLYVRMGFLVLVGFFTTCKFLEVVGVEDFGLINLISGVVLMFSFLSGMISAATIRFFNFELGRKDSAALGRIFGTVQLLCAAVMAAVFVLAETVGLWAFKAYVDIPADKQAAALVFYQWSLVTFLLSIALIPYTSLLISHENMKTFSWLSILDAALKLCAVYLLYLSAEHKIVLYGVLIASTALIGLFLNWIYCRFRYPESHQVFYWEKRLFTDISVFVGWNFWGGLAQLLYNLVINVLLNNAFGVVLNAARAISLQVSTGVSGFTQNFLLATRPQIIKYWASGDLGQCYLLTLRSARFGFFLLYFFALPLGLETGFVLHVWLQDVPAYSQSFIQLILIQLLIDSTSYPLMTLAQASGRIALYQMVVSSIQLANIPAAFLLIRAGCSPNGVMAAGVVISALCLVARLFLIRRCAGLPVRRFLSTVVCPAVAVAISSALVPWFIVLSMDDGWARFVVVGFACVLCMGIFVLLFGLQAGERAYALEWFKCRVVRRLNFFGK